MRFVLLMAVIALSLQSAASAQTTAQTTAQTGVPNNLSRLLESEAARFSGKAGIYVKHLGTGEEGGVRADAHFDSASTIKLAIMALAFQQVDQKKINLDDRYEMKAADYRPGSGVLRYKQPGLKLTMRDVITQMIVTSDNTATDIMTAKVGGVPAVNAFLAREGYKTIHLNMTDNEYFRQRYELIDPKYKSLSAEDVFALSSDIPSVIAPKRDMIQRINDEALAHHVSEEMHKRALNETTWHGIVSPAEIGRLLESIERGTVASKDSSDEMKLILRAQVLGTRKLPQFLNVPVAHKTGETAGVTNDVGIIYAHSGPIVIAVYDMGYTGNTGEADDRISNLARLVVDYFDDQVEPATRRR